MMKAFDYLVAENLEAAAGAYAGADPNGNGNGKVALKAGGIDLLDLMKQRIETPQAILSIDRLDDLRYIRQEDDGVHIGALTTLAQMGASDLLAQRYAALHQAAADTATPQVRQRATIAGNLCQRPRCWYYRNPEFDCLKNGGDRCFVRDGENEHHAVFGGGPCHILHPSNVAPALVALNAVLVVHAAEAEPQRIDAAEFFVLPRQSMFAENVLEPGQIITEIILPAEPRHSATVEVREKQSFDWPLCTASVARLGGGWRICLGAVAPIPWLSEPAMRVVADRDITAELAAEAGEAAAQGATPLSDNGYKVDLIKVVTRRALMAAAGLGVRS